MEIERLGFSFARIGIALAAAALLLALGAGCKGIESCPDEAGIGRTIKVYEINVASDARSQVFIGTVATQTPMYQEPETAAETPADGSAYVTMPTQPVTAGANGGTASGKYVLQVINDGAKRAAETDLATAATLASGLQQSQVGQTSPITQREGTTTGTQTQTSSPQQNDATQFNPNVPVTGQGSAQVTSPVSTQAGAAATPGAVSGGSGAGTQSETTTTPAATQETTPAAEPAADTSTK